MSVTFSGGGVPPQPVLAWDFQSSNVDYVTGQSPSQSTINTYAAASGGTITTSAGNRIHTFTSVGTTSITFLFPVTAQVLVVAGGGGGGGSNGGTAYFPGGGGGAGEVYYQASYSIPAGTYTVTVGDGGAGGTGGSTTSVARQGSASVFGSISANGGGSGGHNGGSGQPGGSGGGAARSYVGGASVKTAGGQGNAGGNSTGSSGAGGGGAGGAGANQTNGNTSNSVGSAGGAGVSVPITGLTYGAGGSGGDRTNGNNGGAGTTNRGNGGGGGDGNATINNGGKGGSGIVIISYPSVLLAVPTYVAGKYNQAISFNNQNAATVSANSYSTYTLSSGTSNSFSLSCWINPLHSFPTTTVNPNYIVMRDAGGYYSLQTFSASSTTGFYANEGSGTAITQTGIVSTGKWDHHCFVLSNVGATSSNTIVTYYFNGTTQGTGNVQRTNGFSKFSALDLGYRSGLANSGAWCSLDDIRLFDTPLSASQIQAIYNQNAFRGGITLTSKQGLKAYFTNSS